MSLFHVRKGVNNDEQDKNSLLLLVCVFLSLLSTFVKAETGAEARREPFQPLVGAVNITPTTPILPDIEHLVRFQNFEVQQPCDGNYPRWLGTYATVLAPDGKTYMVTLGTAVGQYEGTVSNIAERTWCRSKKSDVF